MEIEEWRFKQKDFVSIVEKSIQKRYAAPFAGVQKRSAKLTEEKKEKNMSIFSGCYYWKISKDYWLIVEASENTTLKELDWFIRDIWVECCEHLSAFTIHGEQYESNPDTDSFWGKPSRNMNYRLKDVVDVGDNFYMNMILVQPQNWY